MKKQSPGTWRWIVQLLQAALGQRQPLAKHGDVPCPPHPRAAASAVLPWGSGLGALSIPAPSTSRRASNPIRHGD